jgi:hypothetical protein
MYLQTILILFFFKLQISQVYIIHITHLFRPTLKKS